MLQELFRIPGLDIPIFGYGLMLVIGFLAAIQLGKFLANRAGLNGDAFINAGLLALLFGVLGARLSHVLEDLIFAGGHSYFRSDRSLTHNLINILNIRNGGLTYYGGFLLAIPVLLWYLRKTKLPIRFSGDIIAPCVMVGLAFGRIGCLLNGCCYGAVCELPWAIQFPYNSPAYIDEFHAGIANPPRELLYTSPDTDQPPLLRHPSTFRDRMDLRALAATQRTRPYHPAQIYSAITAFLIAGVCLTFLSLPHVAGRGFALMLMLEGGTRFLLETLRVEPAVIGPLSYSMAIGLALLVTGVVLWVIFGLWNRVMVQPAMLPLPSNPITAT